MIDNRKFDKHKCVKCKYHSHMGGASGHNPNNAYCNYNVLNHTTCLKRIPNKEGEIYDIRGDDFNNCKMYCAGKAIDAREGVSIPKKRSVSV